MGVLDSIEAEASPTVAHADVCVDGRLLAAYIDVQEQLQGLKRIKTSMLEDPDMEVVSEQFKQLHEQVKAKTRRYTFTCIDRIEREALQDQYPPTEKQKKKGWEWDANKYEPVLAGTCLIEVDGEPVEDTVERRIEHFRSLYKSLPQGDNGWGVIAKAVSEANFEGTQIPKFARDIGDQFVSGLNLTTAQNGESPSAPSGAE